MDTTDTTKTGLRSEDPQAGEAEDSGAAETAATPAAAASDGRGASASPKKTAKDAEPAPAAADDTAPAESVVAPREPADAAHAEPGEPGVAADTEADHPEDVEPLPQPPARGGFGAGVASVVGAGLGLASLTGTWLGTVMAERQTLLGQIKVQSGKATDQIGTVYGSPWHTTALVNGVFAVLAVLVSLLGLGRTRPTWVRAVACGGLVLGVIGLVISLATYFGLLASVPNVSAGGS